VLCPLQITELLALAVTTGSELTVTPCTAVFVQPPVLVPVTVYDCVEDGVNEVPFVTPPVHTYVEAPPPFNVVVCPLQITELLALAVTTGIELTVTPCTAVFVQPAVLVPVTV
jgi:hypothetical protein